MRMPIIRVSSCDNFGIDDTTPNVITPKEYPWTARVAADTMIHVKAHPRNDPREGTLAFSGVATDDDAIALVATNRDIDVEFVFGDGTGGTVDKGLTATDSAQNLKAAVQAYADANAIDLIISGGAATLTFDTEDPYVHIEEVVDDGSVMTVTAIQYVDLVDFDDPPFNEFDDLFFAVGEGEAISFLAQELELSGFCSIAEVERS